MYTAPTWWPEASASGAPTAISGLPSLLASPSSAIEAPKRSPGLVWIEYVVVHK